MVKIQSWLGNSDHNSSHSKSPSFSSSATTSLTSHETHSTPTLCEDTSFNSLDSTKNNYNSPISKPSISHFYITSLKTLTPQQISCVAVHNNNLYAATIEEINVYDLASYALIDTFGSGSGIVKSIAFSDKKIFTAHQDCKIRVWKVVIVKSSCSKRKHELILTLPTLKDRIFNCLLAKNYVRVRRHKHKLWIEHADVSGLAVNNDVGLMYSVSWDKSFKIWKISSDYNMHCLESVKAHHDAIKVVVINPFDDTIYTGSADGEIKVWEKSGDSKKHLSIATLAKHESRVNSLALTKDGSVLCSGGGDKLIYVWEKGGHCENYMGVSCSLKGHEGAILSLIHVNGVVISGSSDKTLRIWKYGKDFGECFAVLEGHCKPVKSIVAISDGDLDDNLVVFSGSLDGEIRVWKVVISHDM